MAAERGMTLTPSASIHADANDERRSAERKRLFWLGWVGGFACVGILAGAAALVTSFLTACRVLHEGPALGIIVSALLVGCLASFLLTAHGMDRIAALRRENDG